MTTQKNDALRIAKETLNQIQMTNPSTASILRGCLIVASYLEDHKNKWWIEQELGGYDDRAKLPYYRCFTGRAKLANGLPFGDEALPFDIKDSIHRLEKAVNSNENMAVWQKKDKTSYYFDVPVEWTHNTLFNIQDNCLKFLIGKITEIQYSGTIHFLIETIQKEVDSKIYSIDPEINSELQSISTHLNSNEPSDWAKVALSCRRILTLIADKVCPPQKEPQIGSDGNRHELTDGAFINRILFFLEQKESSKLTKSQLRVLAEYLEKLVALDAKGVHSKFTKYETEQIVVHTYLVLSEIIKNLDTSKKTQSNQE